MAEIQHHGEDSKGTVEQQHVKDSEIPCHGKDSEGKSKQQPVKSQELTDVHLRWLAGNLGPDWEPLAASLGFNEAHISNLKEDSPYDLETPIFNMLVEWKQRNPPSLCQIEKLSRQLIVFGRSDLTQWLRELTDGQLRLLAGVIDPDWEPLAASLGFDEAQISKFKEDSLHPLEDPIFNMLVEWKQQNPPSLCQIEQLSRQLNEFGRNDLTQWLREFFIKEALTREPTGTVKSEPFSRGEMVERRLFPGVRSISLGDIGVLRIKEVLTREPTGTVKSEPFSGGEMIVTIPNRPILLGDSSPITISLSDIGPTVGRLFPACSAVLIGDTKKEKGTSSKRNLLQTLLEEFRKMTAGFTGAELLKKTFKLPYIAIAYINERGGSLTLEKYNVHMYIPRGALAKGSLRLVYIFVDPSAPPVDGVNPPYVALSPMIQCGPTGLHFLDSVVLSFPHHASNEWDLSTRMCHSDEGTRKIWQALDAKTDGTMVLSRDNKVVLLLKHFTLFVAGGTPSEASAKLMKTGAFGTLCDPSDARYAVRTHVWNNDPVAEKKVIDMENYLDSKPLDVYRDLQVFYNQGDLNATIDNIKTGWEMEEKTPKEQKIPKTAVWLFATNSVTFDLTRETNDGATASISTQPDKSPPGCDSFVYQLKADSADSSWEGHKVRLSIRPKQGNSSQSAEIPERQEEESCQICHQNPSSNAGICAACREELKGALTDNTGKETDGGLGGLSKKTVKKLSRFLKNESEGRSNTMRLAEELFGQGTKLIATLRRGMANPAKQVLKLYFSFKREDHVPDQDAVVGLLEVFRSLDMEEAVQIVQAALNSQAFCRITAPTGDSRNILPWEEYTTHSQANSLEIADEKFLWQLAEKLGPEWEKLAAFLGFTSADVYRIKKNDVEQVEKQIFTMLVRWRKRYEVDGSNWKCKLAEQLNMVKLPVLAEFVIACAPSPEL